MAKRFCNWNCFASWKDDGRYGVFRQYRSVAGECVYCGAYVPTNAQLRNDIIGPLFHRVVVYRTSFGPDGIADGDYGPDAVTEDETLVYESESEWTDDDLVTWTVGQLREASATQPSSSGFHVGIWYSDPDGSYIANYYTGESVSSSGHLYGYTPMEERAVWQAITKR